jgi:hypothetical protein
MELTDEQLEVIRQASREIDYGRVTIDFTGAPSFVVDITAEKRHRFQRHRRAEPTNGKPLGRHSGGFRNG